MFLRGEITLYPHINPTIKKIFFFKNKKIIVFYMNNWNSIWVFCISCMHIKLKSFFKNFLICSYELRNYTGAMTAGEHKSLALIYINTLAQIWLEKFKEFCLNKTNGMHIMIAINSLNSSKIRSTRSAMHGLGYHCDFVNLQIMKPRTLKPHQLSRSHYAWNYFWPTSKTFIQNMINICFWYDLNLKSHALLVNILKMANMNNCPN